MSYVTNVNGRGVELGHAGFKLASRVERPPGEFGASAVYVVD